MPAIDSCHFQVVRALQKDNWAVSPKSPYIFDPDMAVYIDIEATKPNNGQGGRQIYVEVKCFPGHNSTQELYVVFGQYVIYRALLAKRSILVSLYLAIPKSVYDRKFNRTIQRAISDNRIKYIVVDLEQETVVQWRE